jgi:hypothetical protein
MSPNAGAFFERIDEHYLSRSTSESLTALGELAEVPHDR